eukprot:TRINITY_DN8419_c0_g2_i1.p1 TRINITY_DN8419_c0_g2~~TRINITY_DN8419_c0_g2_i1.p1  ORF type:complete len:109 (-),score=7.15 TRINITY_DN8419_c0_g2_i1:99-425(-)
MSTLHPIEVDVQPQQEEDSKSLQSKKFTVKWLDPVKPCKSLLLKNHSSVLYKDSIYIFGGYDGTRNHDTLLAFRLDKNAISVVSTVGILPKRRNGHSATVVGRSLTLF